LTRNYKPIAVLSCLEVKQILEYYVEITYLLR
jgi:hypothetical protein